MVEEENTEVDEETIMEHDDTTMDEGRIMMETQMTNGEPAEIAQYLGSIITTCYVILS